MFPGFPVFQHQDVAYFFLASSEKSSHPIFHNEIKNSHDQHSTLKICGANILGVYDVIDLKFIYAPQIHIHGCLNYNL